MHSGSINQGFWLNTELSNIISLQTSLVVDFFRVSIRVTIRNSWANPEISDNEAFWTCFVHKTIDFDEFIGYLSSRLFFSKDVNVLPEINAIFVAGQKRNSFTKQSNIQTLAFQSVNTKQQSLAFAKKIYPDFLGYHALEELEFHVLKSLSDVLIHKQFKTDGLGSSYRSFDSRVKTLGYTGVR